MASDDVRVIPLRELLAELPRLTFKGTESDQSLQDLPLETQLLSLADISLEQELTRFKESLEKMQQLEHDMRSLHG